MVLELMGGSAFWTFHPGGSSLSTYLYLTLELLFATKQNGLLPPITIREPHDQVRPGRRGGVGGGGAQVTLEESQKRELPEKLASEMGLLPLL